MQRALLLALFSFLPLAAAPPGSFRELSRQFLNPPAEFRTMPFFVWDGEVTEAAIDQYLTDFHEQGIGGVFIHPRPGLITPYLSERWFSLARYAVAKGKQLGMEVWLYDENSYPSGFAGGNVPAQMPESYNEGQGLILEKMPALKPDAAAKYPVILKKSGDAFVDITSQAAGEQGREGDYYCFRLAYHPRSPWYGGFSYVDLIRPGVTEKFIELTMRGYERAIGAEFGKTVPGIFSDEPHIQPPPGRNCMRWTPDLFAQFEKRWGYDLKPLLPALFEETGDWRKVRHNYYSLLLELFIERWSKPWNRYTEAHKLSWTGHYWEHDWPSPAHGPDNMAMYAWHQVPGIDMLFNQFSEQVNSQFGNVRSVKELASVANQMGRRRALSETYGGGGWDLRFEDMKRLGDWEYVLGVNLMNQHLTFLTLAGARKYDYPQSFDYHEPWWKHYHVLGDYFGRLSLALSSGQQVNRILILEPTTSAWMYASVGRQNPRMMEIGRAFQQFLNGLEAQQLEYDLGSENILKAHGKVAGKTLVVGRRAYDVVVFPPGLENLDSATAKLIGEYAAAGGKLLAFDSPQTVDGAPSEALKSLGVRAASLAELAPADIRQVSGKLFHHRRRLADGELLFLVNSSLEAPAGAVLNLPGKSLRRMDLLTGALEPYAAGKIELPPAGSLLLYVGNGGTAPPRPQTAERDVAPAGPLEVKRLAPNVLQIDYCDLRLGENLDKDLYFYKAAVQVFKYHGLEADPWSTAIQYKTSILDKDHFAADSGFEATFRFEMDAAVDASAFQAVVERPSLWKVLVNGNPAENRPGEWWLDRAFGVYDIGRHLRPGENTIALVAHPMTIHSELEPVYVLGNFGLEPQARGFKIVPAVALATGPWKDQNLPFYSDGVSYAGTWKLDAPAARYKVRLGRWSGTLAEVRVNGKSAGIVGWQPYELDITAAAHQGENRIEVLVCGSLKNLLGPHHGKITPGLSGPGSFRSAPQAMPPGSQYSLNPYGLMEGFRVVEAR